MAVVAADLSEAQRRTLLVLADGEWHPGSRTGAGGGVIGTPAVALCRMGLAERRGASRGPDPRAPGYSYRITEAGRAALSAQVVAQPKFALDTDRLRRAATACRNVQTQATGNRDWFDWVPKYLDAIARALDEMEGA